MGWRFTHELERGRELLARIRGRCDLVLHGHRHVPSAHTLFAGEPRPLGLYNAGYILIMSGTVGKMQPWL